MNMILLIKKIGKIILIVTLSLISICVIIGALGYYYLYVYPFDNAKFDRAIWVEAESTKIEGECIRGGMVGDLKRNYLKIGITSKKEVIALLGDRYDKYTTNECTDWRDYNNCVHYDLGMCKVHRADYDSLHICFDENNKIKIISP